MCDTDRMRSLGVGVHLLSCIVPCLAACGGATAPTSAPPAASAPSSSTPTPTSSAATSATPAPAAPAIIPFVAGAPCIVEGSAYMRAPLVFRFHGKAFASTRVVEWAEAHVGPAGSSIAARTPSFDVAGEGRLGELAVGPRARHVVEDHVVVEGGRVKEVTAAGEVQIESELPAYVEGRSSVRVPLPCSALTLQMGPPPSTSKVRGLRPGATALLRSAPGGAVVARVAVPPESKPSAGLGAGSTGVVWGSVLEERAGAARIALRGDESSVEGWVDATSLAPAGTKSVQTAALAAQADAMERLMHAALEAQPERPPACRRPIPIYVRDGGPAVLVGAFRAGAWIRTDGPAGDVEVPVSLGGSDLVPFVSKSDLARCDVASNESTVALVRKKGLALGAPLPAAGASPPAGVLAAPDQSLSVGILAPTPAPTSSSRFGGPAGDVALGGHTESSPVVGAARVLAGLRARFRNCYARGLVSDPKMKGNVVLTITVAPNGDVTRADVTKNSGISPAVATCITDVARRASFDAPGGTGSTLTVPFTLIPPP